MNKIVKSEIIKVAQIHEKRILFALKNLEHLIPFTSDKINSLSEHDFLVVDFMANRFAKLQDFVGSKVINIFLDSIQESYQSLTMLDKLNKLEKFQIIEDKDIWQEMRELRNHLAHEYPDQPELCAQFLNQTYHLSYELLKILKKLIDCIQSYEYRE